MRFPMIKIINCLKYAQQCQNGISMKTCKTTTVPYSVISPRHYVNIGSMGNSLITVLYVPDAEKHALWFFYSVIEFKNRYVRANINL